MPAEVFRDIDAPLLPGNGEDSSRQLSDEGTRVRKGSIR